MSDKLTDEYKKIGARIREVRISKGMSQADLSDKSHISLPHISDIELGKSRMMLTTFIKVIEALQVSADSLLRPDVPVVNNMYQGEFSDILEDCSPSEIDSILKIVKELKSTMHSRKNEYDD